MNKKRIRLYSYDGVQAGRGVYWSDTWVEIFVGKRNKLKFGPTYISVADYVETRKIEKPIDEQSFKEHPEQISEYIRNCNNVDRYIASGYKWNYLIIDNPNNPGCPDIIINKNILTAKDIENATHVFLVRSGFIKRGSKPKFCWNRMHGRVSMTPYSIAADLQLEFCKNGETVQFVQKTNNI